MKLNAFTIYKISAFSGVLLLASLSIVASVVNITEEGRGAKLEQRLADERMALYDSGRQFIRELQNAVQSSIDNMQQSARDSENGDDVSGQKGKGKLYADKVKTLEDMKRFASPLLGFDMSHFLLYGDSQPSYAQLVRVSNSVVSQYAIYKQFSDAFEMVDAFDAELQTFQMRYKNFNHDQTSADLVLRHLESGFSDLFSGRITSGFLIVLLVALLPDLVNVTLLALSRLKQHANSVQMASREQQKKHQQRLDLLKQTAQEAQAFSEAISKYEKPLEDYVDHVGEWVRLLSVYQTMSGGFQQVFDPCRQSDNDSFISENTHKDTNKPEDAA